MNIVLGVNSSERNAINKTISNQTTFTGTLKSSCSVINPSVLINAENLSAYNYCYIAAFNRYYFISDITSVRNGLWRIDCSVDVLMSYKNEILALNVIVSDASVGDNQPTYMMGDVWKTSVKTKTDVINFPSGMLDNGEYILITSGGVVS